MKKYLRSKIEEANRKANAYSSNKVSDPPWWFSHDDVEKGNSNLALGVQPSLSSCPLPPPYPLLPEYIPLPPYPPPESKLINIKKEIVADEYNSRKNPSDFNQSDVTISVSTITPILCEYYETIKPTLVLKRSKRKKTMCRYYILGICRNGDSCKYAHKFIFCEDFMENLCKLPKCNYIHANEFERECFVKTGKLPRRTLRHLIDRMVQMSESK